MQDDRTPFHIDTPFGPLVFERLANIYRQARGRATSPGEFAAHALDFLQVRFELDERQLQQIPRTGPAVVVANHPYGDAFLRSLGPALELGRSFVSTAYQRDFGALLLLWKGIAQYVACHPRVVRSDARIRWLH